MIDPGIVGTLFLSGLLGSLGHCLGMCGPLVVMVGLQIQRNGMPAVPIHLLYHTSRILVYGLLGAIAGAIGSLLGVGSDLSTVAGIVSLILGAVVILVGFGYLGWMPLGQLEGASHWLNRMMGAALQRGGPGGVALLGALNGLLPCGLVYSALLMAAATGGALPGALSMLVFGLATLPALMTVGLGAGAVGVRWRQALLRAAGAFIVVVGVQLAARGLASLGAISHLRLGWMMLW